MPSIQYITKQHNSNTSIHPSKPNQSKNKLKQKKP